jgi:hypothetical protein
MIGSTASPTLADVFHAGFEEYLRTHGPLPPEHYKLANAIMSCRTEALGGRLYRCDDCGHQVPLFNSCRNRHCPQCQAMLRARWVQQRSEEVLPVPYFHVVFTVPEPLKAFALRNKAPFYSLMFRAVADTLNELAANPRHLGGRIGFIAILHTWTQTLTHHPHIHCIVPAGALADDGVEWIGCRKDFLFPVNVVKALYRGTFMARFKEAIEAGDILFHGLPGRLQPGYQEMLDTLYQTEWVVYMKESFGSPVSLIKYPGAYTNRIAIANARIKKLEDGRVTISYRDRRAEGKEKLLSLPVVELIRRFLLHVVPPGFVRIRHYGLLSNRDRAAKIEQCRTAIEAAEWTEPLVQAPEDPDAGQDDTAPQPISRCPHCRKGRLFFAGEIPKRPPGRWRKAA